MKPTIPRSTKTALMAAVTHYEVLGVARTAHPDVVKRAHRSLASLTHPDRVADADAHELTVLVNGAYAVLSDANARRVYDSTLLTVEEYVCTVCSGTGQVTKQVGFKRKQRTDCGQCGGTGRG